VITALAVVAAVAAQMQYLADEGLLRTANFFSFFTIQSNVLAVVLLLGLEFDAATPIGRFARWARGGVTLYMTMTGAIYAVLLAPVAADVSTQLDWVNTVVHVIAPIVVLADWLVGPIEPAPTWRTALAWLAFPIAWLAYTVVRGLVVDWYPYPFIDPRDGVEHAAGSWPAVIVTTLVLSVVIALLAFALAWAAARRSAPAAARSAQHV
jgi:hypothetical protein